MNQPDAANQRPRTLDTRWVNLALLLLGVISLVLYIKGARDQYVNRRITTVAAGMLGLAIPYFLASAAVLWARPARSTFWLGIAFALAFRIVGLTSGAYLSTDLYRYIWDGRVQAAHINPFRYRPADEHLRFLRDHDQEGAVNQDADGRILNWNSTIYPNINRKTYAKTIYPPVAQAIFLAVTRLSETVTCIRLTMVIAEALAIWGLVRLLGTFGLPAQRALLYAWHPLVCWEFSGGGHVDAIMIAFLVLTLLLHRRGRPIGTGLALACAVLVKLFPILLAPALYRRFRWGWRMPVAFVACVVLAYLPYCVTLSIHGSLGFLPKYTNEEGLQSGDRFFLLTVLPQQTIKDNGLDPYTLFVTLAGQVLIAACAWALWRPDADDKSALRRCLCLATIFTAVLSAGYDWYYSWLVPFLCFLPYPWLFWMTASSMVLYFNWIHFEPKDVYRMNAFIEYPAALLGLGQLAWMRWGRRRRQALPAPDDKPLFAANVAVR